MNARQPIQILLYNNVKDDISIYRNEMVQDCSVRCRFDTWKRLAFDAYDAVLFSIIKFDAAFPSKPKGQIWIAHCGESIESYYARHWRNARYMAHFDLQTTYRVASTIDKIANIHFNYLEFIYGINTESVFTRRVDFSQKNQSSLAVWIQTNCKTLNQRELYVTELMKYIAVDSYGACLHNKDFPFQDNRYKAEWGKRKINLMSQYLFVLVFENSNTVDYVTEKLFHAFLAGAIPVYMGAPNVEDFLPAPDSIIKVSDFSSAQQLANYLNFVANDYEVYNRYHKWRGDGWSESFLKMLHYTWHTLPCRVCEKVAELRSRNEEIS